MLCGTYCVPKSWASRRLGYDETLVSMCGSSLETSWVVEETEARKKEAATVTADVMPMPKDCCLEFRAAAVISGMWLDLTPRR